MYVLHYRILKHGLANDLKLVKMHRGIKFIQSKWLRTYIALNSKMRANGKNEFERNLFKLMNNAVHIKNMEKVRKYVNVKLVTKWEVRYRAKAFIAKSDVVFHKTIYVGSNVLDFSNILIYDFHYE